MKLIYLKQLAFTLLIAVGMVSCKEDDTEVPLNNANLAGTYKLTALTQAIAISSPTSIYEQYIETCRRDDTYEFKADGSAKYTDAGTTCSTPAETYDFDWELVNKIVNLSDLSFGDYVFPGGEVKKFDGKTLIIAAKIKNQQTNNIEVTITATLVKQ